MIYYSADKINDWNFEDQNIVKVYRNQAVCFYKMVAGKQEPCYSVVDDITQYSDTEFIDVFDKTTSKWYKLNNLNDYEEYGIYGEGRNITYYEGKLTIDNGYEYQYSGSGWVSVGEVSAGTKTSGFTIVDVPTSAINENVSDGDYVVISYYESSPTNPNTMLSYKNQSPYLASNLTDYLGTSSIDTSTTIDAAVWKIEAAPTAGQFYLKNANNGMYWAYQQRSSSNSFNLENTPSPIAILPTNYTGYIGFVEKESGYASYYGGYGLNRLYGYANMMNWFNNASSSSSSFWGDSNASFTIYKLSAGGGVEYPVYYDEKQAPPQNLVFTDMAEAEAYACPYEGLMATIGGDLYIFSKVGNDYEWVALAYTLSGTTKSSTDFTLKINGDDVTATVYEDNGDNTYNWGIVYTDPITSVTQMASGNTNLLTFDWGTADTRQLTSIGNEAFRGCSAMTSMPSIPSGVTSFGDHSFRGCYNMNSNGSIVIPEGIVSIGSESFNGVFNYSSSPRSIYLPSTLTSVGDGAFTNRQYLSSTYVTSLSSYMKIDFGTTDSVPFYQNNNFNFYVNGVRTTSIVVPSDVTELKKYTFYRLSTLTSVTIPNTVTKWDGAGTFSTTGLRTATIASDSSLTKIGGFAFNSTYLTGFTVPSSISRIEGYAFSDVGTLTSFTIPSNVTHIGDYAFNGCSGITSITIPSSVTSMGRYAFRNCTGMTSVTMESSTPPSVYAGVFEGYGCPIYVPCNAVSAYRSASNWSSYSNRIVGYESCTTYQWVSAAGEYYCDNGDKYSLEMYQRSFDGGTTWEDTGDYRLGTLIEAGSADCNVMSLDEYIAASSTGSSGTNIIISPAISGVKRVVVDLTERGTNGSFCYFNVKDSVNANLMMSISSYNGSTTLMYGSAWSGARIYSMIDAASRQDITWCYYDKVDKNKIIFDFEAYDSTKTFVIETWQINFNTPFVVEIWV